MKKYILFPCVYGVMSVTNGKRIVAKVQNNGRISILTEQNKTKLNILNKFLIRGIAFLFIGIYNTFLGINYNLESMELKGVDRASKSLNVSKESIASFVILILSLFLACFLIGFVPIKLSYYLSPKNFNVVLKRIIIAIVKFVIIYLILLALRFMPTFKNYYGFNSAINNKQKQMGEVNFLTYFVSSVMLSTFFLAFFGLVANSWYFIFINLFVSLFVFAINYELYLEIQKIGWLSKIFYPIYFLTLQKPSPLQEKCVNIVLSELELTNSKRDKMQEEKSENTISFSEAYVQAKEILEKANKFEKSDLDYIFAEVLNKSRAQIRLVKNISMSDFKKIEQIAKRRASGEPITKIFGHANFYGLDFIVTKDVLSPRMDTERLVETVLNDLKPKQSVLDIGTGSGAIAVSIAKNSTCKVTAVDISKSALDVARQNAKNNNVKINFVQSDLFSGLGRFAKFDVIVSNPPYIPSNDVDTLDEEVKKHDPILALDGGASGLDFYEKIIDLAPHRLTKNGKIYFEVGIHQAKSVKKLLQKNFKDIRIVKDYNKIDRVVCATLI